MAYAKRFSIGINFIAYILEIVIRKICFKPEDGRAVLRLSVTSVREAAGSIHTECQ